MRVALLAAATFILCGCAGTGGPRPRPPAAEAHKTPVARELPSPAQKQMARRLAEGQEATGPTEVQGPLVR